MTTGRAKLVAASSEETYEANLWMAEIGRMGNSLFSASDRAAGGAVRERGMALTTHWILDRQMPGAKAILWAHNLHVAKSSFRMPELAEGALEPMGVQLSEQLGSDYLAVGATFGSGAFGGDLPPGERVFEPLSENTMDGALAALGLPAFLLDLRTAGRDSPAAKWLLQPREWRAQEMQSVIVPGKAFDLVYFVTEVSRSQPTPLALSRYQALNRGR